MTPRRGERGYTIVELMMSIVVLAIGVSGVIAMQKVAIESSRNAKEIAIATRVAEGWADKLAEDGSTWSLDATGSSTRPNTIWLQLANPTALVDWFIPTYSSTLAFGPAFDGFGNAIDPSASVAIEHFCVHIRFAFLHSETTPTVGNGVIRAQVRVFWPREDAPSPLPTAIASALCATNDTTLTQYIGNFHEIYLTTAVRQTPQGLLN